MKNLTQATLLDTSSSEKPNIQPFFIRKSWFDYFAQHISKENSAVWLDVTKQENEKILPLINQFKTGVFGVKGLRGMSNYYSLAFGMIDHTLTETLLADDFNSAAIKFLQGYDCINMSPLYQPQADFWLKAFKKIGFSGQRYQHSVNWYHDKIIDINQYWSLRPPRLLNTIKRKREQMHKNGEFSTKIYSNGTLAQLIQALIDYHQVYYHSWKQTEAYPAFIDAIAEDAWQQDELRIGVIYHQQKPVAAQIWFISQTSAYIFKLAHVESYTKFSPGTVLMAAMLEHVVIQDKVNRIDFLTGNDSYKQDWMSDKQPLYGIYMCNKHSLKGLCLATVNTLGQLWKKLFF
ncbi:GNAT family N-acetyltransferase [Arsukibacterium sp. MJ3]|uniref:GNAT family N-acetyltransferase n=1 Tax=Arsukibacterium sp. MJ3 TaxID=1632859 RepID=UPI00069C1C17|nr:GNAT family N-acetyltransferase [Arsukibacterium sp. MJ3]